MGLSKISFVLLLALISVSQSSNVFDFATLSKLFGSFEVNRFEGQEALESYKYEQHDKRYEQSLKDEECENETISIAPKLKEEAPARPIERHGSKVDIKVRHRPIIGILAEPLRGTFELDIANFQEYIPLTHIQFLEQSSAKVVPISHTLSPEELEIQLQHVNGLYICGDSKNSYFSEEFKSSVLTVLKFARKVTDEQTYTFPVFFFGNSMNTFLDLSITGHQVPLTSMSQFTYTSLGLRPVDLPHEAGFLGTQNFIENAQVITKQEKGLRYKEYMQNINLRNKFNVLSTFRTGQSEEEEFVAIMEGVEYPIYILNFNIDLKKKDGKIDHYSASRTFMQSLSTHIADELRSNLVQKLEKNYDPKPEYQIPYYKRPSMNAIVTYETEKTSLRNVPEELKKQEAYFF